VRQDLALLARRGSLLATSLMEATLYFTFGMVEVYLPLYLSEHWDSRPWKIGTLFTAQIVVVALTKPATGRLSDRHGRVPLISGGLLLCAATTALMPVAAGYPLLLALVAGFGLGMSTVTASTSAFVADLSRTTTHGAALARYPASWMWGTPPGRWSAAYWWGRWATDRRMFVWVAVVVRWRPCCTPGVWRRREKEMLATSRRRQPEGGAHDRRG
jgi:MFS family permease